MATSNKCTPSQFASGTVAKLLLNDLGKVPVNPACAPPVHTGFTPQHPATPHAPHIPSLSLLMCSIVSRTRLAQSRLSPAYIPHAHHTNILTQKCCLLHIFTGDNGSVVPRMSQSCDLYCYTVQTHHTDYIYYTFIPSLIIHIYT